MADEQRKPSLQDGLKTIHWSDLSLEKVAELPCARTSLITGISTGLLFGLARGIVTKRPMTAGTWSVVSFAISSSLSWYFPSNIGNSVDIKEQQLEMN